MHHPDETKLCLKIKGVKKVLRLKIERKQANRARGATFFSHISGNQVIILDTNIRKYTHAFESGYLPKPRGRLNHEDKIKGFLTFLPL
jgi:hypothetical protein